MLKKLELQEKTTQWVFILLCGFLLSDLLVSFLFVDINIAVKCIFGDAEKV